MNLPNLDPPRAPALYALPERRLRNHANCINSLRSDLPTCLRASLAFFSPPKDTHAKSKQDHSAALALVSTRAPASDTSAAGSVKQGGTVEGQPEDADVDLQRAMDLIDLHHAVKLKHMQGEDRGLMQARRDVDAVLAKLQRPAGEP